MHFISIRKHSQQINSQSEDDVSNLFPKTSIENLSSTLSILKENYNRDLHAFQLTNYCYRCHIRQLTEAYNGFRSIQHPQLIEPRISNLYDNQAFVDLVQLSKNNNGKEINLTHLHIPPAPKNLNDILKKVFEKYGYIPNYERFLLFFPTYLEKHLLVQQQVFQSDKIDSKIAYFLGIVAAAQLGSVYVMARMLKRFLKEGGLMEWISQGKFPQKYKLILPLNRYMARAPWEISPEMIEDILENGTTCHWSKNQLALCIQILAFVHSMSTIALGVGLLVQDHSVLSLLNLNKIQQLKDAWDSTKYESAVESKQKLAVMIPVLKQLEEEQQRSGEKISQFKQQIILNKKTLKKATRKSETIDTYMKEIGNELTKQEMYRQIHKLVSPLLPTFQFFEKRGEMKNNVVDYSQFNFKFMAYPILHNFTQGVADKIQGLIEYSEVMTRGNFGNQKINQTREFRKAVRYYSENLCGYTHHQYDFKTNVGTLLPMTLKFYIRLLTHSPLHISRQVIRETNHESGQVECFDLGHLAVLIGNAKMSLELTMTIQAFEL